jgi:hypothetical protein
MGRREIDERPPIEILGADRGTGTTQQVAIGPRRSIRHRGRSLGIALGVVALLLVGLTIGGEGDEPERSSSTKKEERDNQERVGLDKPTTSTSQRPTTTTTTAPALGPIFGEPIEGTLLIYSGQRWKAIDLASGEQRVLRLSIPEPWEGVPVPGGLVVAQAGEARRYPILEGGEAPEPTVLGPADRILPAGPGRLWLVTDPPDDAAADALRSDIRLVDLDGRVLRSFTAPGRYVSEATEDGVLLSRGGRVYFVDEGGLRALAVGWVLGTAGNAALVLGCDVDGSCNLRRFQSTGASQSVLEDIGDPDSVYFDGYESPDGRLALLQSDNLGADQQVLLFDPDGRSIGVAEIDVASMSAPPRWLPDDLGLVIGTGRGLEWIRPDGSGWSLVPIDLPDRSPELLFVITP